MHSLAAVASSSGANPGAIIGGVLGGLVAVFLYWLPTFIAWRRQVPNVGSVAVINIFAWTVVCWVVALAMAARSVPAAYTPRRREVPPDPSPQPGDMRGYR